MPRFCWNTAAWRGSLATCRACDSPLRANIALSDLRGHCNSRWAPGKGRGLLRDLRVPKGERDALKSSAYPVDTASAQTNAVVCRVEPRMLMLFVNGSFLPFPSLCLRRWTCHS